jgi:hypothetical protein
MMNLGKDSKSNGDIKTPAFSKISVSQQKRENAVKHENVVQKKVKIESEDSDEAAKNGSLISGDISDCDVSGSKQEPEERKHHAMSDDEDSGAADGQKVKTEREEPSEHKPNTAVQTGGPATSITHQGAAVVQKKKCVYGAKCYR